MIRFENVSKCYLRHQLQGNSLRTALAFQRNNEHEYCNALTSVSFNLVQGESLGVLGRNGSGKSTLLKLLTRVTRPSSGRIFVRGRLASLLEVGAGFHHDLSGQENIFLAGAILGMRKSETQKKIKEIVEFADINDALYQQVRTYSSGMFLRLAFSVGIHLDCDILVIDEALAVGDMQFQKRCLEKVKSFQQEGGTLVLVSHDAEQLRAVCQRGLVLEKGYLLHDGSLSDALKYYSTL